MSKMNETPKIGEHPILMSTPMVQAYMAGLKNQTRRLTGLEKINEEPDKWKIDCFNKDGVLMFKGDRIENGTPLYLFKYPYGPIGGTLWFRETFCNFDGKYYYKSDIDEENPSAMIGQIITFRENWKPSIHMPRKAARFMPKLLGYRLERLHDISEADCKSEGIDCCNYEGEDHFLIYSPKNKTKGIFCGPCRVDGTYVSKSSAFFNDKPAWHSYKSLWNSINGDKSWKLNPWVWVIDFERKQQECYKYGGLCKFNCPGQCRESM